MPRASTSTDISTGGIVMRKEYCVRILGVFMILLFFFLLGCEDEGGILEPTTDLPASADMTVTGIARFDGEVAGAGVVVTLERVEEGLPASVRYLISELSKDGAEKDISKLSIRDAIIGSSAGDIWATVTDDSGRFMFPDVEKGEYIVTGETEDYLSGTVDISIPHECTIKTGECLVSLDLEATGTFRGTVTCENANNQWGTIVFVQGTSNVAVTDINGRYEITWVPIGRYRITAIHVGYIDETVVGLIQTAGQDVVLPQLLLRRDRNIPPTAIVNTDLLYGVTTQPVDVIGSGSDQDGIIVLYEWDFEDDGIVDWTSSTSGTASHLYEEPGIYHPKFTVTDDKGAIGLAVRGPIEIMCGQVHVSVVTGSDDNPGTPDAPFATITRGIEQAEAWEGTHVFVDTSSYNENLVFPAGVSVSGGNDPTTWERMPGEYTKVSVNYNGAYAYGVDDAVITALAFKADDASSGRSSYAIRVINSASSLRFDDCRFVAGNGSDGYDGYYEGVDGRPGGAGGDGYAGKCNIQNDPGGGGYGGSSPYSSCRGGGGGTGGSDATGFRGKSGYWGGSNDGYWGMPGAGGSGGNPGGRGAAGRRGRDGGHGSNGVAASPSGMISGYYWDPYWSGNGTSGEKGTGGGGGGGGGGQYGFWVVDGAGNGGGGGGGGASYGSGGRGGKGGYGSIAVLLVNSSAVFEDCYFATGRGGNGGKGRNGGDYAAGGPRGDGCWYCTSEIGAGGDGGNGGRSGCGGGGAGGPGGSSYGMYMNSSSPTLINSTYSIGLHGYGGVGGYKGSPYGNSRAQSGGPGLSGETN